MSVNQIRNIGIFAHIDSGKTTLTERILFYSGRIHKIGEVHDNSGNGATMDHMELEKERGITITSATTQVKWKDKNINIIDTPGHVDFTIEVERSLRVLDSAVLVLCAVGGIQSQTLTIDNQIKRYKVPLIAFINKVDRTGANPLHVLGEFITKLGQNAALLQLPIGTGENFEGIIDIIKMKAYYYEGEFGERIVQQSIPSKYIKEAEEFRSLLIEKLCLLSDEIMECYVDDKPISQEMIYRTIRETTINRQFTPVLLGSAYKNKGVQQLLDAIVDYLPSPKDKEYEALDLDLNEKIELKPIADLPTVAMAFKLVEDRFGQLTYTRIYQGEIKKSSFYYIPRLKKTQRVSRIVRMHANNREEIDIAGPGDIVAVVGLDCASGDSICSKDDAIGVDAMQIAEPVIELSIKANSHDDQVKMSNAFRRFMKEDPTFKVYYDEETNETRIAGMGELHLEVYLERIKREYKASVTVGTPKVHYKEAPSQEADFNYKHKKQTGGSGQFAHIIGRILPLDEADEPIKFNDKTVGGSIPKEFIPGVERGFKEAAKKGPFAGFPVAGSYIELLDGKHHPVDSSDTAFRIAAQYAFRQTFLRTNPVIIEPIMKVTVETPLEFQGRVQSDLCSRRGKLINSERQNNFAVIIANIPLSELFRYATVLRSLTQGKAGFSLEFAYYQKIPLNIQEDLVKEYKNKTSKENSSNKRSH